MKSCTTFFWPLFTLALLCMAGSLVLADTTPITWKAGVACVKITPPEFIWMAGYAARTKPAEGKLQDLYAKTLALQDPDGKKLVLITTDLIGMRGKFTNSIAAELQKRHGLTRDQVMFTCSHTHSGPVLASSIDSSVWYPITTDQPGKIRR